MTHLKATVGIIVKNEAAHVGEALDHVLASEFPADQFEVADHRLAREGIAGEVQEERADLDRVADPQGRFAGWASFTYTTAPTPTPRSRAN